MRQHQPIAARLRTIEESSTRRVERRIAKAVESSRHAKPTENRELNTCNWVFRIQPARNGSEGRRHEEDGPTLLPSFPTHLAPWPGPRNSALFFGRHQVQAHEVG